MSENKYTGSQLSKDTRPVTDLVPKPPVPPTFKDRAEYEGFQVPVVNAYRAGLLPESIKSEQAAIVIALKGRELGLEPMYALSTIYLVHGKPGLEGEAMLALARRKYPNLHVRWVELTHEKATLEIGLSKDAASTFTWTVQDALRAGLITKINSDGTVVGARGKEVWAQYTRKMLAWRVISEAITLVAPEAIQGCLTREELTSAVPAVETVDVKKLNAEFLAATPVAETTQSCETEPSKSETKPVTGAGGTSCETLDAEFTDTASTSKAPEFEPMPFETKAPANPDYRMPVGQYFGKRISQISRTELVAYVKQLEAQRATSEIKEMIDAIKGFLA
jgi:hypothetical protein